MHHQRVLVGTDLSDGAAEAARIAVQVASPDAAFCVMHVVPYPPALSALPSSERAIAEGWAVSAVEAAEREVAAWATRAGLPKATVIVTHGDVARELAKQANAFQADLVAIGSRGAGRIERALLGSTARSVLRRSHERDVLVARGLSSPHIAKILVTTDFYAASRAAAARATAIAKTQGAEVLVVHVIDPTVWGPTAFGAPDARAPNIAPDAAWLHKNLAMMLHDFTVTHLGGSAEEVLLAGRPAVETVRFAQERGVDLIVLGSHGAGAVERLLLGSVAEGIVERAPTSVLVVTTPKA